MTTAAAPIADTLEFSQDELAIRDLVREFVTHEVAPIAIEIDRDEKFPRHLFTKMGELGILGIPFAEAWGGGGGDWVSYCLAIEETAKVCASTSGLGVPARSLLQRSSAFV